MKKLIISYLFFQCCCLFAFAEPISEANVLLAAKNFFARNTQLRSTTQQEPVVLLVEKDSQRAYYYSLQDSKTGAWVILSADDLIDPVLAYSNTNNWGDGVNPTFQIYLDAFKDGVKELVENPSVLKSSSGNDSRKKWEELLGETTLRSSYATTSVDILLKTGGEEIIWAQQLTYVGDPNYTDLYNKDCPTVNGGKALTGCVATAMGMIIKYWGDQASDKMIYGKGQYAYKDKSVVRSVTYQGEAYNAANMPAYLTGYQTGNYTSGGNPLYIRQSTTTENNEVAKLLYHCGVAVNMDYDVDASGAGSTAISGALSTFFGFGKSIYLKKDNFSQTEWTQLLKNEMDAARPVLYSGLSPTEGGHAFVLDGYDKDGYFHVNWGWGGYNNAFVNINSAFRFPNSQDVVVNIQPDTDNDNYLQVLDFSLNGLTSGYENMGDFVAAKFPNGNMYLNVMTMTVYNPTDATISFTPGMHFCLGNDNMSYYQFAGAEASLAPNELKVVNVYNNNAIGIPGSNYTAGDVPSVRLTFGTNQDGLSSGSHTTSYISDYLNVLSGVPSAPAIHRQPVSQTVKAGKPVALKVYAQGNNVKYQWYKDGGILTGKTSNPLLINSASSSDAGSYVCIVSDNNNSGGISSSPAILTVTGKIDPTSITDFAGISKVKTYPNPVATGQSLTIDLGEDNDSGYVSVYNLNGILSVRKVLNEQITTLPVDLPAGTYLLNVTTNKGIRSVMKLMVTP